MGGLEAFAGLLEASLLADDSKPNYQYTEGGQRFISAMPRKQLASTPDRKGSWMPPLD